MEIKKSNLIKGAALAVVLYLIIAFNSSPTYAQLGDNDLSHGVAHDDVAVLQQELKDFGLYNKEINEYYGKTTEYAVRVFQIENDLTNTGIFDRETYEKLNEVKNIADLQLESEPSEPEQEPELTSDPEPRPEQEGSDEPTPSPAPEPTPAPAPEPTPEPEPTPAPSANGGSIVSIAKQYNGGKYASGGASPSGFDCSGFTMYVYGQAGISIPRTSGGQAGVGSQVSKSNLQPGDILIFSNTYTNGISHSGIYLGGGQFIHAANSRVGVEINTINSGYWSNHFSYGRRVN